MGLLTGLLAARARHAGPRWALVAVAVALAAVPLVVGPAVGATTAAAALRRGVAALPAGERSATVSYTGIPDGGELAALDAAAGRALGLLGSTPIRRQLLFNEISDGAGQSFRLAGTDDLAAVARLVSGRLPSSCRPGRCEVVLLAGRAGSATESHGRVPALDPGLGLVVVGTVERTDPLLLSGTFDPGDGIPVLVAGAQLRTAVPERLSLFGRAYGWVAAWDADRVTALGVDDWLDRATAAGSNLARTAPGLVLTVPDGVLRTEADRAGLSASRLGLLAAGSCVVLLGAAVVGGSALRRDHEAFGAALRSRGAGAGLVFRLLVGEGLVAVVVGVVVGPFVGAVVAAGLAVRGGLPPGRTAGAAVVAAVPALLVLAILATVLLVAAVAWPAPVPGRSSGLFRALEGAAVGCLGSAALVVGAGTGDASGPAGGSIGLLVTAVPALVLVAAALAVARSWPALARALLRLPLRQALGARLGLAAVAGRPGRPAATAAVLTAAVAAAVFAAGYAATLDRGAAEQAAYAVPLDARLLPGPGSAPPSDIVPPDALAAALPGALVSGVVRTAGSVRISPRQADVVQFVGLDPAVLTGVGRWAAVTGSGPDPGELAGRLAVPAPPRPRALPAGRELRIATSGPPVRDVVTAYVRTSDGRERAVQLAVAAGPALVGALPALADATGAAARLDLVGLAVRQPTDEADRRRHALGEGTNDQAAPAGTVVLGTLSVDGRPVRSPWRGWTAGTVAATVAAPDDGTRLTLDYRLTSGPGIAVPPPATSAPIPVAVDPTTAGDTAEGGLLTLLIDGVPFDATPVAVLAGFPTTTGRFAVLDARALADLVGRTQPGTATPAELWVAAGPRGPGALARAAAAVPLDRLDARLRPAVESALRADPVARAATGLLLAGAVLGLAVALVAVALLVAAERADDAAGHYAWEADGVPPGTLRAGLWWGAAAVVVPGTLVGAGVGLALSALGARLVAVTGSATAALPPLHAEVADPWVLAATGAAAVLTLAVAGAVAARSLRGPLPVRRGGGWG